MKWIDYRQKLGIGFSDEARATLLSKKIATFINHGALNEKYSYDDYYRFCLMVGVEYKPDFSAVKPIASLFSKSKISIERIISYYIAFVNTQTNADEEHRNTLIQVLGGFLDDLGIPYEVYSDDDGFFVFPKGVKEFDDALVSDPLMWLSGYPKTEKTYITALKQYSEGIYIRDVADNLRKSLETFLQEFLKNDKNLEKNKSEIIQYLDAQGVDTGVSGLFIPLINTYKNINDRIAKHNDKVDKKLLEFLLYQTGILIRMVLVVHQAEAEADSNAD